MILLVAVINQSQSTILADAEVATNYLARTKGLLGKKHLGEGEGLIIKPCKQIHCFGMKFTIDAVFLDKNGLVCYIHENIKPGQISKHVKKAQAVIELPSGAVKDTKTQIGDLIIYCNPLKAERRICY